MGFEDWKFVKITDSKTVWIKINQMSQEYKTKNWAVWFQYIYLEHKPSHTALECDRLLENGMIN